MFNSCISAEKMVQFEARSASRLGAYAVVSLLESGGILRSLLPTPVTFLIYFM